MIVRCWGARGAIPVSGEEYLKYGGDTTCMEVRTKDDEIIIIDAGTGIRRLGNSLLDEDRRRYAMFFTHAHWDHLLGFPFFKPIYLRETRIAIYGCPFAQKSLGEMLSRTMSPPNFPVNFAGIKADIAYHESCDDLVSLKSVTATPINLSHPNGGLGYKFIEDGRSFVFLTDNELMFKHPGGFDYHDYLEFSADADLLIHDAEYREEEYGKTRAWGHSTYKDALRLALDAGVKKLGLFHHNQDRSDQSIDDILEDCRKIIAEQNASLECFAACPGMEIPL